MRKRSVLCKVPKFRIRWISGHKGEEKADMLNYATMQDYIRYRTQQKEIIICLTGHAKCTTSPARLHHHVLISFMSAVLPPRPGAASRIPVNASVII